MHVIEIKIIAMYVTIAFNKTRIEFNLNSSPKNILVYHMARNDWTDRRKLLQCFFFFSSFSVSVSFTIFFFSSLLILLPFCTLFSFNRIYSRTSYHFVELFFLVVGTNNVKDNENRFSDVIWCVRLAATPWKAPQCQISRQCN